MIGASTTDVKADTDTEPSEKRGKGARVGSGEFVAPTMMTNMISMKGDLGLPSPHSQ